MSSLFSSLFVKHKNADQARDKRVLVVCLDVSGSMRAGDGIDRSRADPKKKPGDQPKCTRFESAKSDLLRYYHQLATADRLTDMHLLLFGEKLTEHLYVKNEEELAKILSNVTLEGETRTDLALKRSNELYDAHRVTPGANSSTFVTLVLTDGVPTKNGESYENLCGTIMETLIQGTEHMVHDADRATTFIQYGVSEYHESSAVRKFLAILDDDLQNHAEAYFNKKNPNMSHDKPIATFDCVDCGQQCTVRKGETDFWDSNIEHIIHLAVTD